MSRLQLDPYRLELGNDAWLEYLARELHPTWDRGYGVLFVVLAPSEKPLVPHYGACESPSVNRRIAQVYTRFAPKANRYVWGRNEVSRTSDWMRASRSMVPIDFVKKFGLFFGATDAVQATCFDAVSWQLLLAAPEKHASRSLDRYRAAWARISHRLAHATRLRHALSVKRQPRASLVESVCDPAGRSLHASGLAEERSAREALSEAIRHRAELNGEVPSRELLVSGRWSLVDRFDTDGKHFVVAYRNPEGIVDTDHLTPREFDVLRLAALGSSNKEVASELGISASTVGTVVSDALKKLRLRSRAQIPSFWRATTQRSSRLWLTGSMELHVFEDAAVEEKALEKLTASEKSVARLVLSGASNKEIAERRGVMVRTVANQVASIFRKLGVTARAELGAKLGRGKGEPKGSDGFSL